jgi:hypothetical protein
MREEHRRKNSSGFPWQEVAGGLIGRGRIEVGDSVALVPAG